MKTYTCKQDHSQAFADARQWLLDLPETAEDFPFGPDVAVLRSHLLLVTLIKRTSTE